jgi:hypothetical protein
MTRTTPRVSFGLYALEIKQDSTPACTDIQAFSKVLDLRTDNASSKPLATYEPDFWLLDGGYKFLPTVTTNVHVGLMSLSMSGADGSFSVSPVLTITFSSVHSTDGITIRGFQYSDDYPDELVVAFYDDSDILIKIDTYNPTSWEFSTEQAVDDFKKIMITFNSTNKPFRYLRITSIDYGELIYFEGTDIKGASIIEQLDPLSAEIPIDSLELDLYSDDATFSVINPTGDYAELQYRQPLAVYEVVDNTTIFIGQYYLDTWENKSENEIHFSCIDLLGVLAGMDYKGGIWTTPTKVEDLLTAILDPIAIPYELDPDIAVIELTGWLPICKYREALQQIAFASGAYVTCSRSGLIRITKTVLTSERSTYDVAITTAEIGQDQSVTLKTLVTGVSLTSHNYVSNSTSSELFNGSLDAGTYTITFNEPMHDLSISGAAISSSGANYAIIIVSVSGTVVLSGEGYTDTTRTHEVNNSTLDSNVKLNILSIKTATLISSSNGDTIAQHIYDYYQQRYLQKIKLFAPTIEIANQVLLDTLYSQQIRGVVEKMEIDLANGFVVQAEITGVVET